MNLREMIRCVNWGHPRYKIAPFVYVSSILTGYFFIDLYEYFANDDKPVVAQGVTTDYLNPNLPDAQYGGDGIGGRSENMIKSYGDIKDLSAVEDAGQDEAQKEAYESRYSEADFKVLEREAQAQAEEMIKLREMQEKVNRSAQKANDMSRQRQDQLTAWNEYGKEYNVSGASNDPELAELDRMLAQAREKGRRQVAEAMKPGAQVTPVSQYPYSTQSATTTNQSGIRIDNYRVESVDSTASVVKPRRPASSYFTTISDCQTEPALIKAIIDEEITAVEGSRVRLRLLEDVMIEDAVLEKGSYLYAIMSGFGSQRVKGSVGTVMIEGEITKINLSIYDTDGLEGLYVPESQFRETSKDIAGGAFETPVQMNTGSSGSTLQQWGTTVAYNAYQKATSAISKAIRKNKVKLKYGTFVYLINSSKRK